MQEPPLFVGLVRVSTEKQADSGLGLDAQLAHIRRYCAERKGELLETYTEIESGKHKDIIKRPKMMEAADHAVEAGATLLIGKLDRLVRSVSVLVYLRDKGVKFVACDNPDVNNLVVNILVAVAENEAEMISTRTKDALRAYRETGRVSKRLRALHPDGVPAEIAEATAGKLGASLPQCRNLTDAGRATGRARSIDARKARARKSAETIGRVIAAIRAEEPDASLEEIARRLNGRNRKTPRGKAWTGKQVARAIRRAAGS